MNACNFGTDAGKITESLNPAADGNSREKSETKQKIYKKWKIHFLIVSGVMERTTPQKLDPRSRCDKG